MLDLCAVRVQKDSDRFGDPTLLTDHLPYLAWCGSQLNHRTLGPAEGGDGDSRLLIDESGGHVTH
jgi:hypothetical protein